MNVNELREQARVEERDKRQTAALEQIANHLEALVRIMQERK